MWVDETEKKWEREEAQRRREYEAKRTESLKLLVVPDELGDDEKAAWEVGAAMLRAKDRIIKLVDLELLRQFGRLRVMADRAYTEWNKNPERFSKIVTGIASDKMTPKVTIKENEHYIIFTESNKELENIMKHMGVL